MKNESFDLELKNLLIAAALLDYQEPLAAPDDDDNIWSLPYRHQRKKMLSDAKKWARSKLHPVWKRTLQQVACLLLVAALTLGTAMTISPTVRAFVVNWVREVYETVVEYHFGGEAIEGAMPKYDFTNIPEGYKVIERDEIHISVLITYQGEGGEKDLFGLQYVHMQDGVVCGIDTVMPKTTLVLEEIQLGDRKADYYYSPTDPNYSKIIAWVDEEANLYFNVEGFFDKEKMIELALSVEEIK